MLESILLNQKGGSALKLLVVVAIIAAVAFVVLKISGAKADGTSFRHTLQEVVDQHFGGDDQAMINRILAVAREHGYSLEPGDIHVNHPTADSVEVDVDYSVPVDFLVMTYDVEFSETLKRARSRAKRIVDHITGEVKNTIDRRMKSLEKDMKNVMKNR